MNPQMNDRDPHRPARRPRHDREDSRQERERDYVKEVRAPRKEKEPAREQPLH
ncbi:MAG: hypothetical protein V4729_07480 [Pseudomonadota bacterium]